MPPPEHLLSLHPSVLWISVTDQMKQISDKVESISIQRRLGRKEKSFNLSSLHSLITVEMGCEAFNECHSVVFESMNGWMNDEWDLNRLQSIDVGLWTFGGDDFTAESNELTMKSMIDSDN